MQSFEVQILELLTIINEIFATILISDDFTRPFRPNITAQHTVGGIVGSNHTVDVFIIITVTS